MGSLCRPTPAMRAADRAPFAELHARLQTDPGWQVHDPPTGHDATHEALETVAALPLDKRPADVSAHRRQASG